MPTPFNSNKNGKYSGYTPQNLIDYFGQQCQFVTRYIFKMTLYLYYSDLSAQTNPVFWAVAKYNKVDLIARATHVFKSKEIPHVYETLGLNYQGDFLTYSTKPEYDQFCQGKRCDCPGHCPIHCGGCGLVGNLIDKLSQKTITPSKLPNSLFKQPQPQSQPHTQKLPLKIKSKLPLKMKPAVDDKEIDQTELD